MNFWMKIKSIALFGKVNGDFYHFVLIIGYNILEYFKNKIYLNIEHPCVNIKKQLLELSYLAINFTVNK